MTGSCLQEPDAPTRLAPLLLSHSALDDAPLGKLITVDDEIVWTNAAMDGIAGVRHAELPGRRLADHLHPADRDQVEADTRALVAGEKPAGREVRWHNVDGSERWVTAYASLARSADGMPLHLDGSAQPCVIRQLIDVTDRKQAEAELTRLHELLEVRNRELERSNEELTQFAYVASHDLSEPLRVIAGHVELLDRRYGDALDDTAREWIGYAVDGCTRMRSLIDDLLEYSRAGRDLRLEAVPLGSVVQEAQRRLATAIAASGATIAYADLPTVAADRGALTQVVANLLSNAIKYAGPGRAPQIELSAQPAGDGWIVLVRDHGAGIPVHQRDRVFRIFQRLHGREVPGTGIGLAICRKVIDQLGGGLRIVDTAGDGTTFELALPDGAMLPG